MAGVGGCGPGVGGLGVDAVGDDGPGDGAEQGEPDRAADLLPVLRRLAATPDSWSATRDMATRVTGMNSRPRPMVMTSIGPSTPPA